jgi:solute carrier family 25 protein 14/30
MQNEGVRGLYKGITASWVREGVYSSLRLGLYEPFKQLLGETDPKNTPLWMKFTAGSMSGLVGSVVGNPTDLLKVRMQAWEGHPQSLSWHTRTVYHNFGLTGFYKGLQANVFRAMILTAAQLGTYDHIKHTILRLNLLADGPSCHFASSICAGVVMATATSPVDIIKTRLMNQPVDAKLYTGFVDCLAKIRRNEGLAGFYKGFTAQWMRMGPFTIIQLMVWERLRKLFGMQGI